MSQHHRTSDRTSVSWRITRALVTTLIVLAVFVLAPNLKTIVPFLDNKHRAGLVLAIQWALALVALVAGVMAIRGWLGLIFQRLDRQAALVLRNLASWALYACLVLALLTLLGVNLSGLLVGGAIAGVIIGAAAQSSLGNFFAGLLLMLARPFEVGVTLRVRTSLAGTIELEGTVADTNAFFTTLRTPAGELLRLPNQMVINSAMTVGKPPLQGAMQVQLPASISLGTLRQGISERLEDRSAEVIVTPTTFTPAAPGIPASILCQVTVRSRLSMDVNTLSDAVSATMAEQEAALPVAGAPAGGQPGS